MRLLIDLPDDKKFLRKVEVIAKSQNRNRKNWIETLVIKEVDKSENKKTTVSAVAK